MFCCLKDLLRDECCPHRRVPSGESLSETEYIGGELPELARKERAAPPESRCHFIHDEEAAVISAELLYGGGENRGGNDGSRIRPHGLREKCGNALFPPEKLRKISEYCRRRDPMIGIRHRQFEKTRNTWPHRFRARSPDRCGAVRMAVIHTPNRCNHLLSGKSPRALDCELHCLRSTGAGNGSREPLPWRNIREKGGKFVPWRECQERGHIRPA